MSAGGVFPDEVWERRRCMVLSINLHCYDIYSIPRHSMYAIYANIVWFLFFETRYFLVFR